MEEKEQHLIEEGKITPIRYVGVFPDTYAKLVTYLQTKPYKEVAAILGEMASNEKSIEINGQPD